MKYALKYKFSFIGMHMKIAAPLSGLNGLMGHNPDHIQWNSFGCVQNNLIGEASTGSGKGLVPSMQQAITWASQSYLTAPWEMW